MSTKEKMIYLWKGLFTKEMLAYLIAGVLATIVNIVSYEFCYRIAGIPNLVSNGAAWVVSVIFAYYTNRKYVFAEEKQSLDKELAKMGKFFAARLFSFGVDELGMWILVDLMFVNSGFSKIIMNGVVIIMNYVFSKLFIFTGDEKGSRQAI